MDETPGLDQEIVGELARVLGNYPDTGLATASALVASIRRQFERLGVDDISPESALRHELRAILSQRLDQDGELLAAGWLLRMRPNLTIEQAQADLGDGTIGTPKETFKNVQAGLTGGKKLAFRHVAVLCLKQWTERWQHQDTPVPSSLIAPTQGKPSPRTVTIARALSGAVSDRFDLLSSAPSLLEQQRMAWGSVRPEIATTPPTESERPRRGRAFLFAAAVLLSLVCADCVTVPQPWLAEVGAESMRGAGANASSIVVTAQKPSISWVGAEFWVPATIPVDSLPSGAPDCSRQEIRAWLQSNGEYQAPIQLIARNRSETRSAWISDITARGETRDPTPGYFVECYQGGHGGGNIDATSLVMEASNGAVGHLNTMPDFFDYQIDPLGMTKIAVDLNGNGEFRGTLTARVTEGSDNPKEIPVGGADLEANLEFVWRGASRERRVGVVLTSTDQTIHWWKGQYRDPSEGLPACAPSDCQSIISSTWGQQ